MMVSAVPADHIDNVWNEISSMVKDACRVTNGRYTSYDVYIALMQDNMTLWIAFDEDKKIHGVHITQIIDYPSKRVLASMFTAGKRLREWRDEMMTLMVCWAQDHDCEAIEGMGRTGWIKMLEPYGVKRVMTMFEKEV